MKMYGTTKEIISKVLDLDQNKSYIVELHEPKSARSLEQNRLLWHFIGEIAKQQQCDDMEIYINALEDANAKYEYILGMPTIEKELKKNFRAVKIVRPQDYQGKKMYVYKCFIGSSKFNTEEMTQLIEIVMKYAEDIGIPTGII